MEGSTAAPAAADSNGQVQAPAQPAVPAQPQAPAQPAAPQAPADHLSPEDQHAQQLREMEQRAQAAEAELQQFQAQGPDDLLSALQGGPEDFELSPEDLAAAQADQQVPGQAGPEQQDQQLAELESYIKNLAQEQAQELVNPLIQQRQVEQVQAWQGKHPDVKPGTELFKRVVSTMEGLAERYQNDSVAYDTGLLDMAYTAAKAAEADAGAVPAEQAGADGASLETGAGQTQVGSDSPDDEYRKALLSSAANPLA